MFVLCSKYEKNNEVRPSYSASYSEAGVRSGIGIAICTLASFMLYRTNKRGLLKSLKARIFHK